MFMRTEDLKAELEGLDFETIQEVDREIQEGIYHEGLSAVVQVVARKPA
jgi:hypothetical protein